MDKCAEGNETREAMLARHKSELKLEKDESTKALNAVKKGSKDDKKAVRKANLERETALRAKHKVELEIWDESNSRTSPGDENQDQDESETMDAFTASQIAAAEAAEAKAREELNQLKVTQDNGNVDGTAGEKKTSKAARRRAARDAKEAALRAEAEAEAEAMGPGAKEVESDALKVVLDKEGLKVFEVPSDGNCLFYAIDHQLGLESVNGVPRGASELRKAAVEYMKVHQEDFEPFVDSDDGWDGYLSAMSQNSTWGSQLELRALASVLECPINVYRAGGFVLKMGEDQPGKVLRLSFHEHYFASGTHYNSVVPAS